MPYTIGMPHWPPVPVAPLPGDPIARTKELLVRLGNPHLKLPPVIHVAGTNGKGSTIALLRAMLEAAGYRVHTYTSPHLIRFNERIVIAGKEIGDEALHLAIERARIAAGDLPVNVFEGTTAAAFLAFSETPADILLMETGMGGRSDPTNVIPGPRLCILTSISRDHMEYLGNDIAQIAWHKAGILREGKPAIVTYQLPEVAEAMRKEGALLYEYGKHWRVQKHENGFLYTDEHGTAELPAPALRGDHQILNAGNAIAAITLLEEFNVGPEHIIEGLVNVRWPGRMEQISTSGNWEVWFDGGHNEGGAAAIRSLCQTWRSEKPLYLITGTTRGKDLHGLLAPLADAADRTFGVCVQAESNCYSSEEMAEAAQSAGHRKAQAMGSVAEAIDWLTQNAPPGRILVFGSLFFRIELVT